MAFLCIGVLHFALRRSPCHRVETGAAAVAVAVATEATAYQQAKFI